MNYYEFSLAMAPNADHLEGMRLNAFQSYTCNIIQNICGLVNLQYQKNFRRTMGCTEEDIRRQEIFQGPFPGSVIPPDCLYDMTKGDKKFLKTVVKAKHAPIYAAHAHLALGFLCKFLEFDKDKGYFNFQMAVNYCDTTSEEEKKRVLPTEHMTPIRLANGTTRILRTVGEYLAYVREKAYPQVQVCRDMQEKFMSFAADGCCIPGDACDGCGKKKQDDEEPLLVCSRCKFTYYCSKDCQVSHWRTHKHECRKKNEFRKGDTAVVLVDVGITPAGTPVTLNEKRDSDEWLVGSVYDKDDKAVMEENQLRVMKPTEKRFRKVMDAKEDLFEAEAASVMLRHWKL